MTNLPKAQSTQNKLSKSSNGQKKSSNLTDIYELIRLPKRTGFEYRFDSFRDEVMVSEPNKDSWRPLTNEDYAKARLQLEALGLNGVSKELVRDSIYLVAKENTFDSAIKWLDELVPNHDGLARVETFLIKYMGAEDTPYTRALSRYTWTALAGRVLLPGIKCDMVPVLVGQQGCGKSTGIQAMAPSLDLYTEISLTERDDDQSRKMRGHLIGEIAELKGIHSREVEAIKAFITRTEEKWVPKYQEFIVTYRRRMLLIGTTNESNFLSDVTGNRRWLPVVVKKIDVAAITEDHLQLWAEARDLFKISGLNFKEVEELAKAIHQDYMIIDPWADRIEEWLSSTTGKDITTNLILTECLGMSVEKIGRQQEMRAGQALISLGFIKKSKRIGKKTKNVYVLKALVDTADTSDG
jgi:predicted P-loop ATPase